MTRPTFGDPESAVAIRKSVARGARRAPAIGSKVMPIAPPDPGPRLCTCEHTRLHHPQRNLAGVADPPRHAQPCDVDGCECREFDDAARHAELEAKERIRQDPEHRCYSFSSGLVTPDQGKSYIAAATCNDCGKAATE